MHFCDHGFRSPAENLACDEALLDFAEAGKAGEILRIWEPGEYFVVLGYGNKASSEVNLGYCKENSIPVHRRCSGGGTVLQGPGAINYSLILRIGGGETGRCQSISAANRFIMGTHQVALSSKLQQPVQISGCTDLSIGGLKFSGNAQRRKRSYLLFHGSFLLKFDIGMMERILPLPSIQPDYRAGRSHRDFLMNLHIPANEMRMLLRQKWNASEPLSVDPADEISRLVREKYNRAEWNLKW